MFKQIALIFALCSTSPHCLYVRAAGGGVGEEQREEGETAASKWKVKEKGASAVVTFQPDFEIAQWGNFDFNEEVKQPWTRRWRLEVGAWLATPYAAFSAARCHNAAAGKKYCS